MKKKILLLGLTFFVTSCGVSGPSLEEVEKSISEGIVTVEDAYEKGWITKEWVEQYYIKLEENSSPMINKLESNAISNFETTAVDGSIFTSNELKDVTYFAFINPETEQGKKMYDVIQNSFDNITNAGGDVLYITTSTEGTKLFDDAKFTTVIYNESMKEAMGTFSEMIYLDGFSGSCNVKSSFPFTWTIGVDTEYLVNMIEAGNEVVN